MLATFTEVQRALLHSRNAARLGISPTEWSTLRQVNMDLIGLREVHRIAVGTQTVVRRTNRDGAWTFAAVHPGHLRSQPQSFRVQEYVEPAWDHTTLKHRVAQLLSQVAVRFEQDPIAGAAEVLYGISRAQPFLGHNDRVGLLVISKLLDEADLPIVPLLHVEHDRELARCLVAATNEQRSQLERYLGNVVNRELLATAEWCAISPAADARWSLRDEHDALVAARSSLRAEDDTTANAFWANACASLVEGFASALGTSVTLEAQSTDQRRIARDAAYRGCVVTPQLPVRELRFSIDKTLRLIVVWGFAGRGTTGASSIHIALEVADVIGSTPAAAFLLVPDDTTQERHARFQAWLPSAIDYAIRACSVRC